MRHGKAVPGLLLVIMLSTCGFCLADQVVVNFTGSYSFSFGDFNDLGDITGSLSYDTAAASMPGGAVHYTSYPALSFTWTTSNGFTIESSSTYIQVGNDVPVYNGVLDSSGSMGILQVHMRRGLR
ncbi:MAG: hypothetical protein GXX84_10600 [Acidobacteria bacterium]|nr:hypothetical protein [Acidobacteriota bacterium]